jgi:hypothetical protein
MKNAIQELEQFLCNWEDSAEQNKKAFVCLKDYLEAKQGVNLDFVSRPGITYSLRATHRDQKGKPLFILVDVIEDQQRWLSVCFYSQMISDIDEKGVFIPQGILGDDAICFDLEKYENRLIQYLEARIDEAYRNASSD